MLSRQTLLMRCVPVGQTVLQLLTQRFRSFRTLDRSDGCAPGFVLQIRCAARQDLIGRADRAFALFPPTNDFLGERIFQFNWNAGEREEAGQGVAEDAGEFRARDPREECACSVLVIAGGVHANADVGVVRDIAGVARILNRWLECPHLEFGLRVESRDFPAACRINCGAAQCV